MPAEETIARIPYTELHLYDVRDALNWYKDVNDAICNNALNLDCIPHRIYKQKPRPKTNKHRLLTEYTLDQINEISAVDVLEGLFKEYTVKDDGTILENGKPTHGYKYSKRLNIIKDFSWKWRPEWNSFQIAKNKFWDSTLTFKYFKNWSR